MPPGVPQSAAATAYSRRRRENHVVEQASPVCPESSSGLLHAVPVSQRGGQALQGLGRTLRIVQRPCDRQSGGEISQ